MTRTELTASGNAKGQTVSIGTVLYGTVLIKETEGPLTPRTDMMEYSKRLATCPQPVYDLAMTLSTILFTTLAREMDD